MLSRDEIIRRFGSTATSPEGVRDAVQNLRNLFTSLALTIDEEIDDGREKSVALTHLEDSSMWAQKALARTIRNKSGQTQGNSPIITYEKRTD